MRRWEYNQINAYLKDEILNKLGQEGWELVGFATGLDDREVWFTSYIFKRECLQKPIEKREVVMEQTDTSKVTTVFPFQ